MRRTMLTLVIAALAASPGAVAASESYFVVMEDGSWVRAVEKPTVENGVAHLRLPNGLLALVDSVNINWERSDDRSRQAEVLFAAEPRQEPGLPEARGGVEGTFSIVNRAGTDSGGDSAAGDEASAPAADAGPPEPDPANSIRDRIRTLDTALAQLQSQQRDLERQSSNAIRIEDERDLERRVADLDSQIERVRGERERLLQQLWRRQN